MTATPPNPPSLKQAAQTPELLPCPFCGGQAEIERKGTHRQSMQYACTNCGARCEAGDVYGLTSPANYKWNNRHPDTATLERELAAQVEVANGLAKLLKQARDDVYADWLGWYRANPDEPREGFTMEQRAAHWVAEYDDALSALATSPASPAEKNH